MRNAIIVASFFFGFLGAAEAQGPVALSVTVIQDCSQTGDYTPCLGSKVARALSAGQLNSELLRRTRGQLAALRSRVSDTDETVQTLIELVSQMQAKKDCYDVEDEVFIMKCLEQANELAKRVPGEDVLTAALANDANRHVKFSLIESKKGTRVLGFEASPKGGFGSAGQLIASSLTADQLLDSSSTTHDDLPGVGAALGFMGAGFFTGGLIGYGMGDGETLRVGADQPVEEKGDEWKTAAIGAGIGTGVGLAAYGIYYLIVKSDAKDERTRRIEARQRLLATPGGVGLTF
ncbi:hypothetical protein COU19_01845 [Candidatus Kaiserbacteria bacterium CG10_big_fil_rev_8_21_14_0_10_56_12]|uniref:Uncharacterized protein n=1 Tax=Candidatus Kaiserbacteria bacterium CG10_big_fil_rev_8_21_14_0_10_56_12 TaxID=1974611 RepID=A0A2H0U9U2_9BACT|nr:MAG: hypothetical protein COU19_01845 [Candidatus Kaiserbacteria bacterium CG10_big_fil_rev_8_21_14_0_10_56_12]